MEDGLPPRFAERRRASHRGEITFLFVLGIVAIASGSYAFFVLESAYLTSCAAALFLYFFVAIGLDFRTNYQDLARIVPYFERDVPEAWDTFFDCGHLIARHCLRLDALAKAANVKPISAFGFEDQFYNVAAPWFGAQEGLATVTHLLEQLRAQSELVDDSDKIVTELEKIQLRLQNAAELGVRFCFHLRADSAYTGHEFDSRRGKY